MTFKESPKDKRSNFQKNSTLGLGRSATSNYDTLASKKSEVSQDLLDARNKSGFPMI